jgi:hypothetical protein
VVSSQSNKHGWGHLECGSLLPLFPRELARGSLLRRALVNGQQAGLKESGSKLPHSRLLDLRLTTDN